MKTILKSNLKFDILLHHLNTVKATVHRMTFMYVYIMF